MSDNEGVIKIKGDTSDLDKKVDKSAEGMKRLGQHAEKAHRHAQTFGDAMSHANHHLERSLIRGISLAHVIKEAAEAAREFQDEAAKASKGVGGNAIKRDMAASRLGISAEQAESLVSGYGTASAEDRNSFFASMAEMKVGRAKQPITKQQAAQLQAAFNSGLYGEDELKKIAESGKFEEINVGARLGALGETARREYATRAKEYSSKERAEEARFEGGFSVRAADAAIEVRNAEHPIVGGLQKFVGKATSVVGGDAIITYFDRIANATETQAEHASESASKPTLAPGAE